MTSQTVLPIVVELLIKSALISSGAWLLLRIWRAATAAHRHLVWLLALAAILMLPCTRLAAPRWAISLEPSKRSTIALPVTPPQAIESLDAPAVPDVPPAPVRVRIPLDWGKIILSIWLCGAVLIVCYRAFGSWRLHLLYRRSTLANDPRIRLLLAGIASELGLRRRVEIRLSGECRVPVTWGWLHPVMLLPRESLQWSDAWLAAAFRHEAAHILRWDSLTRWAAWMACALYWPNPFIWIAAHSLRIAQEQAADDLVLRHGTPPEEYAAQLVDVARTVAAHGVFLRHAVAMASPSTLEGRILSIVDGHRDRRPLSRFATILGSSGGLLILALCTVAQLQGEDEKATVRPASTANETKLAATRVIIPKLEFRDATLAEAIAILQQKVTEVTGDKTAISILSNPSPEAESVRITISLTQVPLDEAVKYIAGLANQNWDYRPGAIFIGAKPAEDASAPAQAPVENPVHKKAVEIILPKFELRDALLTEAIDILAKQSAAFDPEKTGIQIRYVPGKEPRAATEIDPETARITVNLTNIPVAEALRYIAGLANLDAIYTPTIVELRPMKLGAAVANPVLAPVPAGTVGLVTKEWKIMPDWIPLKPGGDGKERVLARDWLTSRGVVFEEGAAAAFTLATNRLLIRNTQAQLDVIDQIIAAEIQEPRAPVFNDGTPNSLRKGSPAADAGTPVTPTFEIQLTADATEMKDGIAILRGRARLQWNGQEMSADTIRYDPATKRVDLTGSVTVKSGNNVIEGDDMTVDLKPDGGIKVHGPHQTRIAPPPLPPGDARQRSEDAGDLFVRAYLTIQRSERLEQDREIPKALELLQNAASQLEDLAKQYPSWQPQVVAYRKARTAKAIERLQGIPANE